MERRAGKIESGRGRSGSSSWCCRLIQAVWRPRSAAVGRSTIFDWKTWSTCGPGGRPSRAIGAVVGPNRQAEVTQRALNARLQHLVVAHERTGDRRQLALVIPVMVEAVQVDSPGALGIEQAAQVGPNARVPIDEGPVAIERQRPHRGRILHLTSAPNRATRTRRGPSPTRGPRPSATTVALW